MAKVGSITFEGKSQSYPFEVYDLDADFSEVGGVYVFVRVGTDSMGNRVHYPLYVGQADSLADRLPTHDKWWPILAHGGNLVCIHHDDDEQSRLSKEADLIAAYNPPCNIR